MDTFPEFIASAQVARLIPAISDSNKERRAASILLAVLATVDEYRSVMFATLGQRVGTKSRIDCYTEVEFKKNPPDSKLRPDGLVIVTFGKKQWCVLVEAKIGRAELDAEQVKQYLQLAKLNNIDALVTISNQFAALPTHHPIHLQKSVVRGVELYHWSWMFALTQATLILTAGEHLSKEQGYILSEVVEYFKHPSTGVSSFDRMNPEWKDLVTKIHSGARPSRSSPEVEISVGSWHQEQRDLCLIMSRRLGRQVNVKLSRAHGQDPVLRLKDDCDDLIKQAALFCTLEIPNAAAPMVIEANVERRTVSCSMRLAAPQDKKKTSARVNWLIRQLTRCDAKNVFIKAYWPGRAPTTQHTLSEIRNDITCIDSGAGDMTAQSFEIIMVQDLAGKFAGPKTFIEKVELAVPEYYEQIGQHLRAWIPTPPKLEKSDPVKKQPDPPVASVTPENLNPIASLGSETAGQQYSDGAQDNDGSEIPD